MQVYAQQASDTTLITQATEISMRAERRAGALLATMGEGNGRSGWRTQKERRSPRATIKRSRYAVRS